MENLNYMLDLDSIDVNEKGLEGKIAVYYMPKKITGSP